MFIRTKDEINLLRKGVDKYIVKDSDYSYEISIDKDTLLKNYRVADTIEELCDMFIDEETKTIFHKHNGYVINWKINRVYSLKALSESYHSVKGAIYTDKGLIYVAKMNSEGNLELL